MDAALGWIGAIVEWFGQFLPRWKVVPTTHGWVMWVGGKRVISGGAGIIYWWPARTEIKVYPVVRQALDLRPQSLSTKDEKPILVGGLITYKIDDIQKALAETWDIDETIKDSALTAIHRVVARMTWAELKEAEQNGILDKRLRHQARLVLEPYGVRVMKMSVTDLVPARTLKLALSNDTIM
jgi:regulator of protease activity HflC (stomatin/prohibitin superfamily)